MEIGFKHKEQRMEDARKEIIAVLEKHDLMGSFTLSSQKTESFFTHVGASWSFVKEKRNKDDSLEFVEKSKNEFGNKGDYENSLVLTIQGIMGILDGTKKVSAFLSAVMADFFREAGFKF